MQKTMYFSPKNVIYLLCISLYCMFAHFKLEIISILADVLILFLL